MEVFTVLVAVGGGVAIGTVVTWLIVARISSNGFSEQRIRDMFASIGQETLRANSNDFNERARQEIQTLTAPLKAALDEQQRKLEELERERQKAYGGIEQMVRQVTEDQRLLKQETAKLVSSLRQPQVRGRWGEIQLRRVVELAGMKEHCDFVEQQSTTADEGKTQRPDLLIRLPNNRVIVVDAKVPLEAYLTAHECHDDQEARKHLKQHVSHIRNHITSMAKRDYQRSIGNAFDFLVLFIPGESFYRAAVEQDPQLIEFAFEHSIVLATPTTLIPLLRAVALGWREARVTENARKIKDEGDKVYRALQGIAEHAGKLGKTLSDSIAKYNDMLGSFERTLFTSAKRLHELDVGSAELETPQPLDSTPRSFSRPELLPVSSSGERSVSPRTTNGHSV